MFLRAFCSTQDMAALLPGVELHQTSERNSSIGAKGYVCLT
jgi:hypothetical protein